MSDADPLQITFEAIKHVCVLLGVRPERLYQAFKERTKYRRVFIQKRGLPAKSDEKRVLHVPPATLKVLQRLFHDRVLSRGRWPPWVHGFVPGRSDVSAARGHLGARAVFSLDFRHAFHSVSFDQIAQALERRYGYDHVVAALLAHLATHNDRLPQGAPSSPLLFTLAVQELDEELVRYAREHGLLYRRYADEVAFSSRLPVPGAVREEIVARCRAAGFRALKRKIHYQERQWGTLQLTPCLVTRESHAGALEPRYDRYHSRLFAPGAV